MTNYFLPKDTQITGKIVQNLIKKHSKEIERFEKLNNYYTNSEKITKESAGKIITRTGYAKYITRLKTGYLLGRPVEYQASAGVKIEPILDSYKSQTIANLDKKLAKDCSIYGRAYERIYSNEEASIKSARIDVRNAILVRDNSVEHDKLFGLIYQPAIDKDGKTSDKNFEVTVLTAEKIFEYSLEDDKLTQQGKEDEHFFGEVPVIEYFNNDEASSDFEDVLTDIDAYNRLKSDRLSDRRKLADSILAVTGARLKEEDREDLLDSMVALLPDGAKMEYISKNTDETGADILRQNINDDIHKISMTPDMTDQNFIGNSSGVALAYKVLPFMLNNSDKITSFESGLVERLRVYGKFLSVKGKMAEIKVEDVDLIFKNSLPKNDFETSQIINNLLNTGLVDKSTLAAQLSFVQNAEEIVALAKKEQEEADREASNDFGEEIPDLNQ